VVSNERFYVRRAAEERLRAARALTEAARERHMQLARDFAARAQEPQVPAAESGRGGSPLRGQSSV
jgi:hypothetical protein